MMREGGGRPAPEAGCAPPGDGLRLERQLCFALYSATNLTTRLYRPLLEPLGLTYPQYLAMLALWERAPRSVGGLGEALGLDSGTLTPLLKRLEAGGLVTRTRDARDERRVLVGLTPAGTELRARAAAIPETLRCGMPLPLENAAALRDALWSYVQALRMGGAGEAGPAGEAVPGEMVAGEADSGDADSSSSEAVEAAEAVEAEDSAAAAAAAAEAEAASEAEVDSASEAGAGIEPERVNPPLGKR